MEVRKIQIMIGFIIFIFERLKTLSLIFTVLTFF